MISLQLRLGASTFGYQPESEQDLLLTVNVMRGPELFRSASCVVGPFGNIFPLPFELSCLVTSMPVVRSGIPLALRRQVTENIVETWPTCRELRLQIHVAGTVVEEALVSRLAAVHLQRAARDHSRRKSLVQPSAAEAWWIIDPVNKQSPEIRRHIVPDETEFTIRLIQRPRAA